MGTAILLLAGCGGGTTGPSSIEPNYVLQTLNESALPYEHEGLGCCVYLSGSLKLIEGEYAVAITARNRNTSVVFTATEWGKYTRQVSALSFAPDSFKVAPMLMDVGTVSGSSVSVLFGGEGHGSPDQFLGYFTVAH